MSEHVYKSIEITGSSIESSDQAVRNAIAKAARTIKYMDWFEVIDNRGHIENEKIAFWQTTIKIGFRLED